MEKLAIFLDNARIHGTREALNAMEEEDILPIFNVPYSPEFNGMEKVWAMMKKAYRSRMTELKTRQQNFTVFDEISEIIENLDQNQVKNVAQVGLLSLQRFRP